MGSRPCVSLVTKNLKDIIHASMPRDKILYSAFIFKAALSIHFTATSHLHPLQVENCDSNSRLVVDEDENKLGAMTI